MKLTKDEALAYLDRLIAAQNIIENISKIKAVQDGAQGETA